MEQDKLIFVVDQKESSDKRFPCIIRNSPSNATFDKIPNYLIETEIFSYLNSKDLYYSVKPVCTEWYDLMKNIWCTKIKEEMIDHVKTIDYLYEKEVLTKTYEFKLEYLYNYRNLLLLYNQSTNVLGLISFAYNSSNDETNEIKKLFYLYFTYFGFNEGQEYIDENKKEELKEFVFRETTEKKYKEEFDFIIKPENFHFHEEANLLNIKNEFLLINKNIIEDDSEYSRLIYSLLQGLIEFETLKYDLKELRIKQKELIKKIQFATNEWPKKKKFFEKAYKLMIYTK